LLGLCFAVFRHGPTYTVKSHWEGGGLAKSDFEGTLKGLEPEVELPSIGFKSGGLGVFVEDGRLSAKYSGAFGEEGTYEVDVNDQRGWKADLQQGTASLKLRGQGLSLDGLAWEASQKSTVEEVGDVTLDFNSDKEYNLTVARDRLVGPLGYELGGTVRATNGGYTGRLEAHRALPSQGVLSFSIENPVGVYDLASSRQEATVSMPVAGGEADVKVSHENDVFGYEGGYTRKLQGGQANLRLAMDGNALKYNVFFERSLKDRLDVDADVHVGADDAGLYGKVEAHHALGKGIDAYYDAEARVGLNGDHKKNFAHSFKVANNLGYATLLHGLDQSPRLRLGYEFDA